MSKKLDKILKNSINIPIDDNTKIVIMSDCHRGIGDEFDNFMKNKTIYEIALLNYYNSGFTYIELGDGDEMWEVKNYQGIIDINIDIFKQLKKFNDSHRLIMIYGNHDIVKKSSSILENYFYKYHNKITEQEETLLNDLVVHESLVLNYQNYDIFLVHGHQVDILNSTLWPLSRFLVQNVWRPLEKIGIKDLTSAAKNNKVAKKTEKKLKKWSDKNNKILIAGHTHRPIFPKKGEGLYFNDGSCVHQNGITCIEIENGNITLVQWELNIAENELPSVKRKVLSEKEQIKKFYK